MSKKFFIIRHGETDFNKRGLIQGSGIDTPLNETGLKQANSFFNTYKDIQFDKIYVSMLQRTQQSVQNFIDAGIAYEKLSGLNEISWGSQEGLPFTTETSRIYYGIIKQWSSGNYNSCIGEGETPHEVMIRQKQAFSHILAQENEKFVLICMHGRALRILLSWLLNYELKEMERFDHQNLCLYELTYTGSMFRIDQFNDVRHLQGHNGLKQSENENSIKRET